MGSSQVRVVIRARDEAARIGVTLERLRDQTVADRAEIVVVDSGSTDATARIAHDAGACVISIPAENFSYGGALNAGCADSSAELFVALSAHAPPRDSGWLERLMEPFSDPRVACTCGYSKSPDGRPLEGRLVQDAALAERYPFWGYSNSAGAFRTSLWRARPFREDMPGTEDKEWAWHWLHEGYVVVVDPSFATEHSDHRDEGPVRSYRRSRNVWRGFAMYLDLEPWSARDLAREWWTGLDGHDGYSSRLRARVGWRRAAALAGAWRGRSPR